MNEIIMTEEEKHYTEITDKIDEYDDTDQAFILWYLMQRYGEFVGIKETLKREVKTPDDSFARSMAIRHRSCINEMRDALCYAIW